MTTNEAGIDRAFRVVLGLVLLTLVYRLVGIDTCRLAKPQHGGVS